MVNTLKRLISIFAIFASSLPVLSYSATQSSYPTKGIPVAGDKALITDSADGNKTKQATVGSFPISTATQTALDGKETKAVVQASAPADTTVDWYDTDQESGVLVLKRHNGTTWVRASSHGVQYASNCAGITAGMCVDTDDGKLYYHNNTSVVEVGSGGSVDLSAYLSKTNTTSFTPSSDYHPATKKYVDDSIIAGGGYTDEQAQDAAGGMFSGNTETGITVTYNDTTGKVDFVVATQSDVNFTSALNTKLAGIATGAEVNVNADWNASSGDAQILNKPTIPTAVSQLSEDATHRTVSDVEKTTWNGKQAALGYTPENTANKGAANGYAGLGSDGKVPTAQLPTLGTTYDLPSLADAQAGTSTTPYVWSPQRVAQAIIALAPSGGPTSIQMTFVSDSALTVQTGSKTKVPTGVDFTTADIGCNASDTLTVALMSSATVNGTYSQIGAVTLTSSSSRESVDISAWNNLTANSWVRIDITSAGSSATECTVAIGGTEL